MDRAHCALSVLLRVITGLTGIRRLYRKIRRGDHQVHWRRSKKRVEDHKMNDIPVFIYFSLTLVG